MLRDFKALAYVCYILVSVVTVIGGVALAGAYVLDWVLRFLHGVCNVT